MVSLDELVQSIADTGDQLGYPDTQLEYLISCGMECFQAISLSNTERDKDTLNIESYKDPKILMRQMVISYEYLENQIVYNASYEPEYAKIEIIRAMQILSRMYRILNGEE